MKSRHRSAPPSNRPNVSSPPRPAVRQEEIQHLLDLIKAQDLGAKAEAERLVNLAPNVAVMWELMAAACFSAQDYAGTVAASDKALALDPKSGVAMGNKATALGMLKKPEQAEQAALAALALPGVPMLSAHNTLGGACRDQGRFEDAIAHYRNAVATDKAIAIPLRNLATLMVDTARFEAGEQLFQICLAIDENDAQAREGLGMAMIARAALSDDPDSVLALGWDNYAARWAHYPVDMFQRFWAGDVLGRRTLYVYRDQGVGDEIYWSGCLPDLSAEARASGGKVIVHVDPRLQALYQRSFPDLIIGTGPHGGEPVAYGGTQGAAFLQAVAAQHGPIDLIFPMPALPFIYRRRMGDFRPAPYLKADPEKTAKWRAWLDALGPGKKVGVTWRSFYAHRMRDRYYFNAADLAPLAAIPGIQLVSLDYTGAEIPPELGIAVPPMDQRQELDEVGGLIMALDAVVGHGGTPSVFAGALGRLSILLTPHPEWLQCGLPGRLPWFHDLHVLVRQPNGMAEAERILRDRLGVG